MVLIVHSKNHIVTSEYAASSTLVSKEIGGDYSDDSVIIYNSDICGNINVSVDKNIFSSWNIDNFMMILVDFQH